MKGGAEDLPGSGEVHDVELVVEDEENVEALVLVHHGRSLMRARTHLADCLLDGVEGVCKLCSDTLLGCPRLMTRDSVLIQSRMVGKWMGAVSWSEEGESVGDGRAG